MNQMLINAFFLSIRSIQRNLLRSFLTLLGVVIGVVAVVTMVSLGQGATLLVAEQIARLGSNLLVLRPGQQLGAGRDTAGAPSFRRADVEAIQHEIPTLKAVAPVQSRTITLVAAGKNWSTQVSGTTNAYFSAGSWTMTSGRVFEDDEESTGKSVCVIGSTVRRQLFGLLNPLGDSLRIKNMSCEIIGVLASKGQGSMGQDLDDIVVMPILAFHRRIAGNQNVSSILMSMHDGVGSTQVISQVSLLMRERRKLSQDEEDNFHVRDTRQVADALSETVSTLTVLLGAVSAVSLLVGGIGIMNIMLVSVTERTKEIGIRLAIGALEKDVLLQFLIESVVLSGIGGLLGIVLGLVTSLWLTNLLNLPFVFDTGINMLAFVFSAMIGIIFGYFPARRAARLDPIEALRYE